MVRRIFRTGNSLVVALPKEALECLQLGEGGEVSVELADDRRIVIAPARRTLTGVDEAYARQVAEFIERYRPALDALAR